MANNDAQLMIQTLAGDSRAAEALFGSYRSVALALANSLVGDRYEAEDVVQEASMKAFTRMAQLEEPAAFGAWFAAIIRSVGTDHLRKRFRIGNRNGQVLAELRNMHDDAYGSMHDSVPVSRRQLDTALGKLSPVLAAVIRMRFLQELSIPEIALALRVPQGTVKRRLHDALTQIRRRTMNAFTAQSARELAEKAGTQIAALPRSIRRDIIAVAIGGDLARGDHHTNYSALLVFPLFSNRTSVSLFQTESYKAVCGIFDTLCAPYRGYCEAPPVWQHCAFDTLHLPITAERFQPPYRPGQVLWHSLYLFDLIDHHFMIYGDDYVKSLYRPAQRHIALLAASSALDSVRSRTTTHPAGFPIVSHWEALRMVRILQMYFAPGKPTIRWETARDNYVEHVPSFPSKPHGLKVYDLDMNLECYPGKAYKLPSKKQIHENIRFCEEGCAVLTKTMNKCI